ncbi:hypothetical protein [Wolbachia endosymbiont of Cantharis cryptica]|uniref:hypothetical protein n=1 Tax=Wolbachia endosymbiont of Cantharis cryptica TaxID=3066132 RepID=UPI00376EFE09
MKSTIELKQVTDYKVYENQGYKSYHITSGKKPDSDSHGQNYSTYISPETQGIEEKPTGLHSVHIAKDSTGSGYIDYIDIKHLNLVQEPEHNERDGTVTVELEFAQVIKQPAQVFSHTYGKLSHNDFIEISMDLI